VGIGERNRSAEPYHVSTYVRRADGVGLEAALRSFCAIALGTTVAVVVHGAGRLPVCANAPAWLICFRLMNVFRERLRLFAAAWILFQVTSLSTLVPRACCLAHQSVSVEQHTAPHCSAPLESESTAVMPHDHARMHEQASPSTSPAHECALRGTCGGPTAALLALLSTHGVLTDSIPSVTEFPLTGEPFASAHQLIPQFESPDSPPPRA
jgi:hypothetical protein